jgi:hypothetical protein
MKKRKRKKTAAEKRAKRERKRKYMTIFINGKQKRVPRPQLVEGMPVDEFIARNADPIWLHQNELWELMTPETDDEQAEPIWLYENEPWELMAPEPADLVPDDDCDDIPF